ncbi:MAG: HAMP domain-containing histidine kinase [Dorea sp.]|jgi:signal transduction histidine kinase|nr:HAMP domain-containing histidine kinase [Dorea sp.]
MKKELRFPTNIVLLSTGIIFILLTITMFISNTIIIFLLEHGIMDRPPHPGSLLPFLLRTGIISILIGTILTLCIGHLPLRPLYTFMQAIHSVSDGNFHTKIYLEHPKEFRELSRCFNQMTEELSQIELLRSDFINNFSHEFKTPMVSILGFAQLLKKGNLNASEQAEYLDIIIDEAKRLTALSTNILNLSKVESMSLLTDSTTFNVGEQIRECVVLLEKKWTEKDISFDLHLLEQKIDGNAQLLKQVWTNLIDNAIKFSPVKSEIILSMDKHSDTFSVTITDNGCGMDEKTQHYIFDKFYQGDSSHSSEGNGLGLALVKKIIELHHGTITVNSHPLQGSSFMVTLPIASNIT